MTDYRMKVLQAATIKMAEAGLRGDERMESFWRGRVAFVRSEPQPCPSCGNLYDHRYPCVG